MSLNAWLKPTFLAVALTSYAFLLTFSKLIMTITSGSNNIQLSHVVRAMPFSHAFNVSACFYILSLIMMTTFILA